MSSGIGGSLLSEEDFVVSEVISPKFLRRFSRKGSRPEPAAGYFLYILRKKGLSTEKALRNISAKTGVPLREIGYAGLKDSFAVTLQYITLPKRIPDFCSGNSFALANSPSLSPAATLSIEFVKPCSNRISVGDLEGNSFVITLHNCRNLGKLPELLADVKKGFPNAFGPQRFAERNHIIGKSILLSGRSSHSKEKTKFFIHAYQSYLFNRMLENCPRRRVLPLIGYKTKKSAIVAAILSEEGLGTDNFRLSALSITCEGGERLSVVKPENLSYETTGSTVVLKFFLPKGSYATALLSLIQ